MATALVRFYTPMSKHKHYPKRWSDVLDVMIEKGKGSRINKLRVIQIVEADLQLLMRIFLGIWLESKLEEDERLSKPNYGSRKGFSIDSALLEKRLLFDYAKRREESNIYLTSDLEACCDRQLPNIGGIVAESVGVNRNMMNILSKMLPK